jgi:MFS family permease
LALVVPAIQSLVADSTEEHERGVAFGWLGLTGNIGSILGGFLSVILAGGTVLGYPGWRMSFHLVAVISVLVGALVRCFAVDPRFSGGRSPPP